MFIPPGQVPSGINNRCQDSARYVGLRQVTSAPTRPGGGFWKRRTTLSLLDPEVWTGKIFSDGWRAGGAGTSPVIEVATGESIGIVGVADAHDVELAGKSAVAAQVEWAQASFRTRAGVMHRAAQAMADNLDDLAQFLVRESGSTIAKATGEIGKAIDELLAAAALADQPYGELVRHEDSTVLSMARRVPVGVVGVIAPWNAPIMLAIRSVAPALALGNAVLLKPDLRTSVSGGVALARIFELARLPDGVFHVLNGGGDIGEALVRSPHTSAISFTGSSAVGHRVGEIAGGMLKKTVLELGGNNAMIVLDDADVELAVNNAAFGSMYHQGQICMATGRHLVHHKVADEYVERLAAYARSLVIGDPRSPDVRIGPLIDDGQARRVHSIVDDSVKAGAVLQTGGRHDGRFYEPTVLDHVNPSMRAYREEIFGPVIPVTRFSTDDEAVELANGSKYGLSAAIHTVSMARGLALASRLHAGMIHVNDQTINDAAQVPMGGIGESGNGGRYGGRWNLDGFTYWQWVTARQTPRAYPE